MSRFAGGKQASLNDPKGQNADGGSKKKITNAFMWSTALITAMIIGVGAWTTSNILKTAKEQELKATARQLSSMISGEAKRAVDMALLVSTIPQVQEAFAKDDRETLQSYFAAGFNRLSTEAGVRQFQFHKPPATSFLRVHKLQKHGDDLSSFRNTVVEANTSRLPIQGFEVGVAGLGLRGVVPMYYQNNHYGTVEFGLAFDRGFFDTFKAWTQADVAMYVVRDGRFEEFASTAGSNKLVNLNDPRLANAIQEEVLLDDITLRGKPRGVLAVPVKDYSGRAFGVAVLAIDTSYFDSQVLQSWILYAITAAIALFVIGMLSSRMDGICRDN